MDVRLKPADPLTEIQSMNGHPPGEYWAPIRNCLWLNGQPCFQISNLGRVRSWLRRGGRGTEVMLAEPRLIGTTRERYVGVTFKDRERRWVHKDAQVLVLESWIGPKPSPTHQARHLNGNSLDNRVVNLAWGTARQNAADKRRHGTELLGARNPRAKLTRAQVLEARRLRFAGWSYPKLAARYQVATTTAFSAVTGQTWGHLPNRQPLSRASAASATLSLDAVPIAG